MIQVNTTPNFDKDLKKLAKKYQSLKNDLGQLINDLENDPTRGTMIMPNVYKIRLGVKSKGGGKSGGLRVITHVEVVLNTEIIDGLTKVRLITIYDKSEVDNVDNGKLQEVIENILENEQENDDED